MTKLDVLNEIIERFSADHKKAETIADALVVLTELYAHGPAEKKATIAEALQGLAVVIPDPAGGGGGLPNYDGPTIIEPETTETILPTQNKSVRKNITVKAVTAAVDPDIKPENIKKGVNILGVDGALDAGGGGERLPDYNGPTNIIPSIGGITLYTNEKSMTSDIIVNPVTSAIDSNIKPENIKAATKILGVDGTLEEREPLYMGSYHVNPKLGKVKPTGGVDGTQFLDTAMTTLDNDIEIDAVMMYHNNEQQTREYVDPVDVGAHIEEGYTLQLGNDFPPDEVKGTLKVAGGADAVTNAIRGPIRFDQSTTECFPKWLKAYDLHDAYSYTDITEVIGFEAPALTNRDYAGHIFYRCEKLAKVIGFSVPEMYSDWVYKQGSSYYNGSPFEGCYALTTIGGVWNVGSAGNLFDGLGSLSTILPGTKFQGFTGAARMFRGTAITEIPSEEVLPMAGVKRIDEMYASTNITRIDNFSAPGLSSNSEAKHLFYNCKSLVEVNGFHVPGSAQWTYGTSSSLYIGSPFEGCSALKTISGRWEASGNCLFYNLDLETCTATFIGLTNTSKMFYQNNTLKTLAGFDVGEVMNASDMFKGCSSLTTLTDNPEVPAPWNFKTSVSFVDCPLDHDSAMKVINGLQTVSGQTVTFSTTTTALLSESDKAIAKAKGWEVA